LKLDHQLNQLVLAQALQISPFHEHMDSEIALRGKGVGKYPPCLKQSNVSFQKLQIHLLTCNYFANVESIQLTIYCVFSC